MLHRAYTLMGGWQTKSNKLVKYIVQLYANKWDRGKKAGKGEMECSGGVVILTKIAREGLPENGDLNKTLKVRYSYGR